MDVVVAHMPLKDSLPTIKDKQKTAKRRFNLQFKYYFKLATISCKWAFLRSALFLAMIPSWATLSRIDMASAKALTASSFLPSAAKVSTFLMTVRALDLAAALR